MHFEKGTLQLGMILHKADVGRWKNFFPQKFLCYLAEYSAVCLKKKCWNPKFKGAKKLKPCIREWDPHRYSKWASVQWSTSKDTTAQSVASVQRFSRAGPRGRGREWATLGVHPLSWLLSKNQLEEVCGTLTKDTFSSRLLLSNQDKGCTPSVAHSLPLPLPPGFSSTCQVCHRWRSTENEPSKDSDGNLAVYSCYSIITSVHTVRNCFYLPVCRRHCRCIKHGPWDVWIISLFWPLHFSSGQRLFVIKDSFTVVSSLVQVTRWQYVCQLKK